MMTFLNSGPGLENFVHYGNYQLEAMFAFLFISMFLRSMALEENDCLLLVTKQLLLLLLIVVVYPLYSVNLVFAFYAQDPFSLILLVNLLYLSLQFPKAWGEFNSAINKDNLWSLFALLFATTSYCMIAFYHVPLILACVSFLGHIFDGSSGFCMNPQAPIVGPPVPAQSLLTTTGALGDALVLSAAAGLTMKVAIMIATKGRSGPLCPTQQPVATLVDRFGEAVAVGGSTIGTFTATYDEPRFKSLATITPLAKGAAQQFRSKLDIYQQGLVNAAVHTEKVVIDSVERHMADALINKKLDAVEIYGRFYVGHLFFVRDEKTGFVKRLYIPLREIEPPKSGILPPLITKSPDQSLNIINVICDIGEPEYGQNVHPTVHGMLKKGVSFRFDHKDKHNQLDFEGKLYTTESNAEADALKSSLFAHNRNKLVQFEITRSGPPFDQTPHIAKFHVVDGSVKLSASVSDTLERSMGTARLLIGIKNFEKDGIILRVKGKWSAEASAAQCAPLRGEHLAAVMHSRGFSQEAIHHALGRKIASMQNFEDSVFLDIPIGIFLKKLVQIFLKYI